MTAPICPYCGEELKWTSVPNSLPAKVIWTCENVNSCFAAIYAQDAAAAITAARAGSRRSPAKASAARTNGRKGGRPRIQVPDIRPDDHLDNPQGEEI